MKHLYLTFAIVLLSLNYGFGQCSAAFTVNVPNCEQTATFTATGYNTNTANLTYTWDFGNGTPLVATSATVTHTYPTVNGGGTNTYTATLTVTGTGCGANGTTDSQSVVINQVLMVSLQHVDNPTGIDLGFKNCNSTQSNPNYTIYVKNISTSLPNTTYNINWGDASTNFTGSSIPNNTSHQYTSQGLFTITVTATGSNGCSVSEVYNFFNGNNPAVGLTTLGNGISCNPGTFVFPIDANAVAQNPQGTTYTITVNDGSSSVIYTQSNVPANYVHTFNSTSCGIDITGYFDAYQVEIVAENSCNTSTATVKPIRVYEAPVADFEILPSNTNCANQIFTFDSDVIAGNYFHQNVNNCINNYSTQWIITPNTYTITSGILTDTVFNATFQPGTYNIQLIVQNLASITTACPPDTITKQICVLPNPIADFSVDNTVGCAPISANIINNSNTINSCDTALYVWHQTVDCLGCSNSPDSVLLLETNSGQPIPISFDSAGVYTFSVEVSNLCGTDIKTETFTIGGLPAISLASIPNSCGSFSYTPTVNIASNDPNIGAVTYNWTFQGGTPATGTGQSPGTIQYSSSNTPYTVSVTASSTCGTRTVSKSFNVFSLPTMPTINAVGNGNATTICEGDTIFLKAINPANNLTYQWSGPGISTYLTGQTVFIPNATLGMSGNYILSILDTLTECTNTNSISVQVKARPTVSVTGASPICAGQSITLTASGASSYSWSNNATTNQITVSPNNSTTYTVVGIATNGCQDSESVVVTVNPLPQVNAGADVILCNQSVPTQLSPVTPFGGMWSGAGIQSNGTFTPSQVGNFTVTYSYTDGNNCVNTDDLSIQVDTPRTLFLNPDVLICEQSPPFTLSATPTGGTWSGSLFVNSSGVFNPQQAGNYTVTYEYGTGTCFVSDDVQITVHPLPTLSLTPDDAICIGNSIDLTVSGASIYVWNDANNSTTATITVAPTTSTTYIITATDANGCENLDSVTVSVNPLPIVDAGGNIALCNQPIGEQLTGTQNTGNDNDGVWSGQNIIPSGLFTPTGTGTFVVYYTYQNPTTTCENIDSLTITVSNPDILTLPNDTSLCLNTPPLSLTATPANGVWSGNQVSSNGTFTPNTVGTFSLIYSFGSGTCLRTDTTIITVHALPTLSLTPDDAICIGNSIDLTVSGASIYVWNDANNSTTATITVAPTADTTYTVTATDVNGCENLDSVTVSVNPLPIVDAGANIALCNQPIGEQLTGTQNTGNDNDGVWSGQNIIPSGLFTPTGTGTFVVYYTYQNPTTTCENIDSLTITVSNPDILTLPNDTSLCLNTPPLSLTATPANGVWSGNQVSSNGTFTPNTVGTFLLIYTFGSGTCLRTDTTIITVNPLPTLNLTPDDAICIGDSIDLTVSGANTYVWNDANSSTTATITGAPTADTTYTVTATDANGCENSESVTVTVNPLPVVDAGANLALCNQPIGEQLTGTQNTGNPNDGIWSGQNITPSGLFTPTGTGTFVVYYTYENPTTACENIDSLSITVSNPDVLTLPNDTSICVNTPPLSLTATPANGVWSGNQVSSGGTFTPNTVGTFLLIYTFGSGTCLRTDTTIITVNPLPTLNLTPDDAICIGDSIDLTVSGANTYVWNDANSSTTATITVAPTADTTYTVTATDANGCENSDSVTVTVNPLPVVDAGAPETFCDNPIPVPITLLAPTVSGATNGGSGIWTGSIGIVDAINGIFRTDLAGGVGVYTLTYTYTDANGCINSDTKDVVVTAPTIPQAFPIDTVCAYAPPFTLNPNSYSPNTADVRWQGLGIIDSIAGIYDPTVIGNTMQVGQAGVLDMIIMSVGSGTCKTFDTTYIFIAPIPSVEAGSNIAVCEDAGQQSLTNYLPIGGVWSGTGIVGNSNTFDPAQAGTLGFAITPHILTYTYTDIFTTCANSDSLTATVNPLPQLNTNSPISFCDNPNPTDILLTVNINSVTPFVGTTIWSGTGIINPTGIFRTDVAGGVGSYVVIVDHTDGNGCTNTDTLQINVVPPVFAQAYGDTVCYNEVNVILNGYPSGGFWYGNGVNQTTGVFDPVAANATVHGASAHIQYTPHQIIYEYGTGTCQTFDTVSVLVIDMTTVVEAGQDQEVCDSSAIFNLTGYAPLGGWWTGNGITNSVNGTFDPAFATAGTHILTYWYYEGIDSCLGSDTKTIIVRPLPEASFAEIPVACISGAITFQNTTTLINSSFQWNFGDGTPINTDVNPSHAYSTTGYYTIQLIATSIYGCVDSFSSVIFVTEPPTAYFEPDTSEGCAVLPINFTNYSYAYQPTYYWDFGNGDTSTLFTPPTIHYQQGEWDTTYYVQLNVTNICGTVYHLDSILVHPIPIVRFATNIDTSCSPMTVTFANVSVGNPQTFMWYFGDGTTSTDSIPPPHTYYTDTVDVTYTIMLISTNECGADTLIKYVTVLPNNVNAFFVPDVLVGCQPLTVDFTSLSSGVNIVHNWDFADGNTSNAVNPVHTFNTAGVFPVKLRIDNGCGYDTMVINITVQPVPVVSFTHNDLICEGDLINFVNTSPNISGQLWQFGDGDTSVLTNPSHPYTTAGTYPVYLTGYAANTGCPGYDSSVVTILPQPTSTFTSSVLDGCVPLIVNFTNTSIGADYAAWTFGDGNSSVVISPTHTFTTPGTYGICLVNTSINGCVSDTTCIQIIVHPKPVSAFTPVISDTCGLPLTVDFTNQSTGGIGYYWDFSNGLTSILNTPTTMYQDTGIHVIGMITVNQFNCADTSYQMIRAFENPVAEFTFAPQLGCPPLAVDFYNMSQFANIFQWSFGDGSISQDAVISHTYSSEGIYDVTLLVSMDNICFDELIFSNAINVLPSPIADFDFTQPNTEPNDGVIVFENLSSSDAVYFIWDFGNGDTSHLKNPSYRYYINGEKNITLISINSYGCADTIQKTLFLNNIKGLFIPNALSPNVGIPEVRVFQPKGVGLKTYHIRIYSSWGELLWESQKLVDGQPGEAWDGTFNGKPMPQDVYTWQVTATFDDGEDTPWRGMPMSSFNKIIYQNFLNLNNTSIIGYTRVGTIQLLR